MDEPPAQGLDEGGVAPRVGHVPHSWTVTRQVQCDAMSFWLFLLFSCGDAKQM